MAVVKANGYGHGAIPAARASLKGGATWLGVARIDEALSLRQAGIMSPVLVFGYIPANRMEEAISQNISLTVWEEGQLATIQLASNLLKIPAKIHLKIDTGMSRLGVQPQDAMSLAQMIYANSGIEFEGVYTHFARADEEDPLPTENQEAIFREVIASLHNEDIRPTLVHAANSARAFSRPTSLFSMVRCGIAIYGLHPSRQRPLLQGMRPALAWKAALSQVKLLPAGRGISYGHEYVTPREELIGTLPVGYADGYRRTAGSRVLIGGKSVPVVGRVCMDQLVVRLDGVHGAHPGDEVVLIGSQDKETITAEDVAMRWGTINYEVVCGISARVPRIYS